MSADRREEAARRAREDAARKAREAEAAREQARADAARREAQARQQREAEARQRQLQEQRNREREQEAARQRAAEAQRAQAAKEAAARQQQLADQRNRERQEAERKAREEAARKAQAEQAQAEALARLSAQKNAERIAEETRQREAAQAAEQRRVAAGAPAGGPLSADRAEEVIRAREKNISVPEARREIDAETQAMLAMIGSPNSAGAQRGGTADRMSAANIAAIYGVSMPEAIKIENTYVDMQRASNRQAPVYSPDQKVSQLPAGLVKPSGPTSPAAGYTPGGPISSTTGNFLIENATERDLTQDLRDTGGGDTGGGDTGGGDTGNNNNTQTEVPVPTPVPVPVPTPTPTGSQYQAYGQQRPEPQQAALGAMSEAEGGSSRTGMRLTPSARGRAEVKSTTPFMATPPTQRPGRSLFSSSKTYSPSYWATKFRR